MADLSTAELRNRLAVDTDLRTLIESRAAAHPDRTFLRFAGHDHTYAGIDGLADRAAGALLERGIGSGDTVAVMMRNCVEWIAVWFGAAKIGALTVPVNVAFRGDGLAHILGNSRATLTAVDADLLPRLEAARTDPGLVVVREVEGADTAGHLTTAEFLNRAAVRPRNSTLRLTYPAAILYTSGTTGPAKGCVLPHGQYLAAAHQMAVNLEYSEADTLYSCLPLFHINAQNYSVLCAWAAGATLALDASFTASGFWQRLIDVDATAFNIIGGIPLMLWGQPESPLDRAHRARVAFGVPVPLEIWERWELRFGVRIVYAYGMTENGLPTLFPYASTPAAPRLRGSGGQASASAEVGIVDEDDMPVAAGEVGEIVTRPKIANTDLGYLDGEGYLFYVDRKKDAMRRRGEMVSSWDVEVAVRKFPGVLDCAAYGVPSELGEDDIMIAVVLAEGAGFEPRALTYFCTEQLAAFQVPRYVRQVAALPRTQTERIEKYKLRATGITADTWDSRAPSS
jgi:carnitine-CoA ligase